MSSVWVTKRHGKRGVRYVVRWIEPESGKNRAKTFKRSEDARTCESQLRRDFANNEYFAPVKISYNEWVKQHLEEIRNSPDVDLSPKTIAGHKEALAALGKVCKPKGPLDITPKMIRQFRLEQKKSGLAARTINKHIAAIRSALSYAVRAEIVSTNKLLGPHRLFLRAEQKVLRILEVGEVVALMNVATDIRHKTTISLAYYHGLRRGEICRLQWDDVDLQEHRLNIVDRPDGHTKTRLSRSVALREETAVLLSQLDGQLTDQYVFKKPTAFYWSLNKWLPKLVKAASLDHCTLHGLRATCNTVMKDAGVPEEAAMQVLGHRSVMVNRRHYTATLTSQQRLAIKALPSIG